MKRLRQCCFSFLILFAVLLFPSKAGKPNRLDDLSKQPRVIGSMRKNEPLAQQAGPYLLFLQERVGNFLADFYSVNGLVLESRKRREHLSEEDILRNKAIMESLSKGGNLIEQNFEVSRGNWSATSSRPPLSPQALGLFGITLLCLNMFMNSFCQRNQNRNSARAKQNKRNPLMSSLRTKQWKKDFSAFLISLGQ